MSTTTYLLVCGKEKFPVQVMYYTQRHYFVMLLVDCKRGRSGDKLYVSKTEIETVKQLSYLDQQYQQPTLFDMEASD